LVLPSLWPHHALGHVPHTTRCRAVRPCERCRLRSSLRACAVSILVASFKPPPLAPAHPPSGRTAACSRSGEMYRLGAEGVHLRWPALGLQVAGKRPGVAAARLVQTVSTQAPGRVCPRCLHGPGSLVHISCPRRACRQRYCVCCQRRLVGSDGSFRKPDALI
jgi:hypothetical protein